MSSGKSEGLGTLKATVALYTAMMLAKLAAYFLTGVMALLAEALHTLSDIFVSGFLLVAAYMSKKEADAEHMYGHGKAQYAGALVAATLFISFTSLELYREAIPALFRHEPGKHQNMTLAIVVLVGSMLITAFPLVKLLFTKQKGAALRAQFLELINDELGLLAALVGSVLVASGYPLADPIASLLVATIIAVNGAGLFKDNFSMLMGRAPDKEFFDKLKEIAASVPGVRGLCDIRAQLIGEGAVQAQFRIQVDRSLSLVEADRIAHAMADKVSESTGCKNPAVHLCPMPEPTDAANANPPTASLPCS